MGILRRASERGKELPTQLKAALEIQAGVTPPDLPVGMGAYHINQRDEGIDLGKVSGALMATSNMQMQTFITGSPMAFVAGFSAGAGPGAGTIGFHEELAPTLKGSASGNMMPSILCLNDQGGRIMDCTENLTGTLRAQEHGHQPLVFENHGIDSRYTGPHEVAPTMSVRYGTGGNNVPLVSQELQTFCIAGNIIDRAAKNGGNGIGCQADLVYTITTADCHTVYSRQRVDEFRENAVVSTESARQHKDATDLICQPSANAMLIRRLTPMECERLQGFPDGWTDIPSASDSSRYKALGNSVAIPCVDCLLFGAAFILRHQMVDSYWKMLTA